MVKMKTHKGLKKRVTVSAGGKVKHKPSFAGHLMSSKSGRRCRRLRKPAVLHGPIVAKIRLALGQG
jgi:large subunit ribosomal protein L35